MGTSIKLPKKYNPGLYAQTSPGPVVTNTIVATSIIGSGVGGLVVPGNNFQVGDSYHAKLGGIVSSANNNQLTIIIKFDGTVLATSGLIPLSTSTNQAWEMEIDFTITSIGATGSVITNGNFIYNRNSGTYEGRAFNDTEIINTTIPQALDVEIQWDQANASDSIVCYQFILHKTYSNQIL
jgi:hypothetical protein